MSRSFFSQISHYVGGQLAVQLASFVSFPTFTRALSTAQYGVMSLVNSTMPMVMPFAKCGMSFASERFYAEYRAQGLEQEFFATTRIFSTLWSLGFVLVYELLLLAALFLLPASFVETNGTLIKYLMLVGPQIFVKAQLAILLQVVRAKQESIYYNTVTIVETYASLGLSLLLLFSMGMQLHWLFIGQTLASAGVLAAVLVHLTRSTPIRRSLYRRDMVKAALHFGTPLIWNEVSAVIGAFADRYVLFYLLGEAAVGVYSVGFNAAFMFSALTVSPLYAAVGPMVFQRWADGGAEAVRALLEPVGRWVLRLLMPLLAGMQAIAEPLVVTLASQKYLEAADIIRLNFFGTALWSASNTLAIAILIDKRTRLQRNVIWTSTIVNVLLALVLVPRFGIRGAAMAFLLSIIPAVTFLTIVAQRILPLRLLGFYLVPSLAAAVGMYFAVAWLDAGRPLLTLAVRVAAGAVVYPALLLLLDAEARRDVRPFVAKIRARLGR